MTTTRINHTGHNHPNTPAARAICRAEIRTADQAVDAHYAAFPVGPDPRQPVIVKVDNGACMYHRDNPDACDKVGAYRVAGDVWCAKAMDDYRLATQAVPVATCSMCGNTNPEDVSGTYSVCCNKVVI